MNISEIKKNAKLKIKGNLWNLLWPLLVIGLLQGVISSIFGVGNNEALLNLDVSNLDFNAIMESTNTSFSPIGFIITLVFMIINAAYLKYVLNFVRCGEFDFNEIIHV